MLNYQRVSHDIWWFSTDTSPAEKLVRLSRSAGAAGFPTGLIAGLPGGWGLSRQGCF